MGQGTVLCPSIYKSSNAPCHCRFWHAGHPCSLTHRDALFQHLGKDFLLPFRFKSLKSGCKWDREPSPVPFAVIVHFETEKLFC